MATLLLTKLWINLLATGEAVAAQSQPRRKSSFGVEGRVVTLAGGRQRAISMVGERQQFAFVLQDVTLTQRDMLRQWCGQAVIVRDHRGQVFYGTYFDVAVEEMVEAPELYTIGITLLGTTTAEGV